MMTIERLNQIYREELVRARSAGLPVPEKMPSEIQTMKATSKFGDCRWTGVVDGVKQGIRIRVSIYHLNNPEEDIRQTVAHEIAHTCPGRGHDKEWRHWAEVLNRAYGYHISRLGTANSGCRLEVPERKGHLVVCTKCGCEFHRSRNSNLTLHPDRYTCGKCHGELKLVY